jgi:hypothetical protein
MPRPSKLAEEARKQAWTIAHPRASTIIKAMPKKMHLNRADSYSVLALIVGVFLVIVVPPLPLKVLLFVGVCIGVFLFCMRSHWTHSWSKLRQRSILSAIVVVLLAVGIPQFISQWRAEHTKPVVMPAPLAPTTIPPQNHAAAVLIEKGGKWDSTGDTIYAPNGTAIENKGEITSKDLRVNPPNPRTVPEQLDTIVAASYDLRDFHGVSAWSRWAADFLRDNFNVEVANRFLSQPNLEKKREFLKRYRDSFH